MTKSGNKDWPSGPWDKEPDRVDFEHLGFPCLALRNRHGAWCGYVAVPEGHPAYGRHYDQVDVDVHGGLTYADHCFGEICHTPKSGESADVFWLGFDCLHACDLAPGMLVAYGLCGIERHFEVYRDLEYVQREIRSLAEQLKRMESLPEEGR